MLNLPRGKYIPCDVARGDSDGGGSISFTRSVYGVSYDRELLAVPGCSVHDGLQDMDLILDQERRSSWQAATEIALGDLQVHGCLLYTSPSPRDATLSRMPSSA